MILIATIVAIGLLMLLGVFKQFTGVRLMTETEADRITNYNRIEYLKTESNNSKRGRAVFIGLPLGFLSIWVFIAVAGMAGVFNNPSMLGHHAFNDFFTWQLRGGMYGLITNVVGICAGIHIILTFVAFAGLQKTKGWLFFLGAFSLGGLGAFMMIANQLYFVSWTPVAFVAIRHFFNMWVINAIPNESMEKPRSLDTNYVDYDEVLSTNNNYGGNYEAMPDDQDPIY